jgi:hypothetical protein
MLDVERVFAKIVVLPTGYILYRIRYCDASSKLDVVTGHVSQIPTQPTS